MIYFIQAGENGPIKIGQTDNLQYRLGDLQIAHHCKLYVRGIIDADESREWAVHLQFKKLRIRGEWFRNRKPLKDFIKTLPPIAPETLYKPRKPRSLKKRDMTVDELRAIWTDMTIPTNDEAAEKAGVPKRSLYRLFKASGRPAGWPGKRDSD